MSRFINNLVSNDHKTYKLSIKTSELDKGMSVENDKGMSIGKQ